MYELKSALIISLLDRGTSSFKHIAISTQYRAQADKYRQEMRDLGIKGIIIAVGKIGVHIDESFQANKIRIIFFNAVVSKPRESGIGFMTNKNQLIVATSRARDYFIIVMRKSTTKKTLFNNQSVGRWKTPQVSVGTLHKERYRSSDGDQ